MIWKENNYAFIDSQNLNLGIRRLGWQLDFKKFRIYLRDKYDITIAYLFLGFIPENETLYSDLRAFGYIIVFKPIVKAYDGTIKGNVDGELILQAMIDYLTYDRAVIVSGDGDFYCLVKYLYDHNKLKTILIPSKNRFSRLLKVEEFHPFRTYLDKSSNKLRLRRRRNLHGRAQTRTKP